MTKVPVRTKPTTTFTLDLETRYEGTSSGGAPIEVSYAVLREPGRMETRTVITDAQLPWFNALRHLLMAQEMGR